MFNLLGIAVVGAALERRTSRAAWTLTYLLGGVGGTMVISAWHPADHGGGSSDAVAALIGALTVLLAAENHDEPNHHDRHGRRPWADWPAQFYCVFFAGYLTALDLGGCGGPSSPATRRSSPSSSPRRALSPAGLTRACLLFVVAAGVTMTAQQDGHGLGIIAGAVIAGWTSVPTARSWVPAASCVARERPSGWADRRGK